MEGLFFHIGMKNDCLFQNKRMGWYCNLDDNESWLQIVHNEGWEVEEYDGVPSVYRPMIPETLIKWSKE
jgi:hypothetical protein